MIATSGNFLCSATDPSPSLLELQIYKFVLQFLPIFYAAQIYAVNFCHLKSLLIFFRSIVSPKILLVCSLFKVDLPLNSGDYTRSIFLPYVHVLPSAFLYMYLNVQTYQSSLHDFRPCIPTPLKYNCHWFNKKKLKSNWPNYKNCC